MQLLQNNDGSLNCSCGNNIFVTMGDDFGFTMVECIKCENKAFIMDTSLIAEKLLSPRGEDYCKVFAQVVSVSTIFEYATVMVDYLLFTEFDTAVMVSAKNRLEKIVLAKEEAIKNERYERAARLKIEEQIISCILLQQKHFLML